MNVSRLVLIKTTKQLHQDSAFACFPYNSLARLVLKDFKIGSFTLFGNKDRELYLMVCS